MGRVELGQVVWSGVWRLGLRVVLVPTGRQVTHRGAAAVDVVGARDRWAARAEAGRYKEVHGGLVDGGEAGAVALLLVRADRRHLVTGEPVVS